MNLAQRVLLWAGVVLLGSLLVEPNRHTGVNLITLLLAALAVTLAIP